MLEIDIPGYRALRLAHLVLDYNGTLACDGALVDGVGDRLAALAGMLTIHILTADTFGKARAQLVGVPCDLSICRRWIRIGASLSIFSASARGDRVCWQWT